MTYQELSNLKAGDRLKLYINQWLSVEFVKYGKSNGCPVLHVTSIENPNVEHLYYSGLNFTEDAWNKLGCSRTIEFDDLLNS